MAENMELLQGTLDLLVLRVLQTEPMHGWGIAQRIQQLSREVLQVGHGSLYPSLQRLEANGWVRSDWRTTENNRRARYYTLTASGRKHLQRELSDWRRFSDAVGFVLREA